MMALLDTFYDLDMHAKLRNISENPESANDFRGLQPSSAVAKTAAAARN